MVEFQSWCVAFCVLAEICGNPASLAFVGAGVFAPSYSGKASESGDFVRSGLVQFRPNRQGDSRANSHDETNFLYMAAMGKRCGMICWIDMH